MFKLIICVSFWLSITCTLNNTIFVESKSKKLSFFFSHLIEANDFYCPRKHINTLVEDLCYYFYRYKRTQYAAEHVCRNSSHRLAIVESNSTWTALLQAMEKFLKRALITGPGGIVTELHSAAFTDANNRSFASFRFHVGSVHRSIVDTQVIYIRKKYFFIKKI